MTAIATRVRATAAATVANMGPGYDVFGMCLEGPVDVVEAVLTRDGLVAIEAIDYADPEDRGKLPLAADQNCVGVAAQHVLDRFGDPGMGVTLWLRKGLPLGSGMGSSGASAVAAALATATLIDPRIPKDALLDACREGERLATGSPHPDNVAPSLLGGIVACLPGQGEAVDILRLPVPPGLVVAAVKPAFDVRTADARAVLPAAIPMGDVVRNMAHIAGIVAALHNSDFELLGRCLEDHVATPYRKTLIEGYDAVVAAARNAGALGTGISGSGPTVFALCDGRARAMEVSDAMVAAFQGCDHEATAVVSAVDPAGAWVEYV